MVKKKSSQAQSKKRILFSALIIVVALAAAYFIGSYGFAKYQVYQDNNRKSRIVAIYDSLKLGGSYQLYNEDVFGDKRVYSYDKSRTFSSARQYYRATTVNVTMDELVKAAEAAGFKKFDEPYPGSAIMQFHFKSEKNEYLRISVSSKPRDDALRNSHIMTNELSQEALSIDPSTAPSDVLIKVNLDDNNE